MMFVPNTPRSGLLNRLKDVENKVADLTGDKVRLVERAGTKLRFLLVSSDPWKNSPCHDEKCLICSNPLDTSYGCRTRSVTYKSYCLMCCAKAGVTEKEIKDNNCTKYKSYWGETKNDANFRSKSHLADFRNQTDDSHMLKHWSAEHSQECKPGDIKFGFSVVKSHKSSFARQIHESVLIFRGGQNVLNSKSEFSRCTVPRLGVTFGDKQYEEVTAAAAVSTTEEKIKRKNVEPDLNQNLPVMKRRRTRGQFKQSFVPSVTDLKSVSLMSVSAAGSHGHGGGPPQQQHQALGHHEGQRDGAAQTFKDIYPHNNKPKPSKIGTKPKGDRKSTRLNSSHSSVSRMPSSA